MNSSIKHVVLTGGVGSRLWPLSRKSRPKQYLKIFENESLFQKTVKRNANITKDLIIVGNIDNYHLSKEATNDFDIDITNIIEATPRNTAAAIAFAALASNPNDVLLVTPSDHLIQGEHTYEKALTAAIDLAEQGNIVTFGIQPTKPETGYGYIEFEGDQVLSFREKPNKETAEGFIEQGNFLWNSGMFCFKANVFLEELKKFEPDVYEKSLEAWQTNKNGELDLQASLKIPSISVDYAVMERSEKIKVVSSNFKWSDLGSFESVYEYLLSTGHEVDPNGNITIGTTKYTAFVGLKNTIFVYTDDANLILKKEEAQGVKKIYKALDKVNSRLLD